MLSFEDFLAEMAYKQGNVSRLPRLLQHEDINFLHQFPVDWWYAALKWRYEEGLLRAMQMYEDGQKVPDVQDVTLKKWSGTNKHKLSAHFKNIQTNFSSMIEKLQRPTDPEWLKNNPKEKWGEYPGGETDYDLSDPSFADVDPNTGKPLVYRDPPHMFNTTIPALGFESAKRNLGALLKAAELGLWMNKTPEEINGQKVKHQNIAIGGAAGPKSTFKNLPAYQKEFEYTVTDHTKDKTKTVKEKGNVPILPQGVILKPIKTNKIETLLNVFNLGNTPPYMNALAEVPLFDSGRTPESIMNVLKQNADALNLTDKWIQTIGKWMNDPQSFKGGGRSLALDQKDLTFANLARAVDPTYLRTQWGAPWKGGKQDSLQVYPFQVLNNWDLLSDKDKESLKQTYTTKDLIYDLHSGENDFKNYWMVGGLKFQQNLSSIAKLDKIKGVSEEDKEKYRVKIMQEVENGLNLWSKKFTGGKAATHQFNVRKDEIGSSIVSYLLDNAGHPSIGIFGKETSRKNVIQRLIGDAVKKLTSQNLEGGGFSQAGDDGEESTFDPGEGDSYSSEDGMQGGKGTRKWHQKGAGDIGTGSVLDAISSKMKSSSAEFALKQNMDKINAIYEKLMQQYGDEEKADAALPQALQDAGINIPGINVAQAFKDLRKQSQTGDTEKAVSTHAVEELEQLAIEKAATLSGMGTGMYINLNKLKGMGGDTAQQALAAIKKYFIDQGVPNAELQKNWPVIQNYITTTESALSLDRKLKLLSEAHRALIVQQDIRLLESKNKLEKIANMIMEFHPVPSRRSAASGLINDIKMFSEMVGTGVVMGNGTSKKEKKYIRSKLGDDANVWGAPGDKNGTWPGKYTKGDKGPIKKSLKEYLEEHSNDKYKKRLMERVECLNNK